MFENVFQMIFIILCVLIKNISASTHWIVTEHGRIQSQTDSTFHLRNPADLIALLEQEQKAQGIVDLYKDMSRRRRLIDLQWSSLETASEVQDRLYSMDHDCIMATRTLADLDLHSSTIDIAADKIDPKKIDLGEEVKGQVDLDCTKFVPLEFSMTTFPHIQVLREPWNVSWSKEMYIELPLTMKEIYSGLMKNRTSWYLYNMAALHWRRAGHAQRALDCTKLALHLASREYKSTPLLNLGVMLQRAQCHAEAAILLHSSIDHSPTKALAHFMLANAYADLGDYNRSIACYDNVLRLDPEWSLVRKAKHAVICHSKLEQALFQLNKRLEDIAKEVRGYEEVRQKWETLHSSARKTGDFCYPDPEFNSNVHLRCEVSPETPHRHHQLDLSLSLQLLLENFESESQKLSAYKKSWLTLGGNKPLYRHPRKLDEDGLEIFFEDDISQPESTVYRHARKLDEDALEIFVEENDISQPESTEDVSHFSKHKT